MAQVDFFLKIEGIDGESQDDKHKGEIDIYSFSLGATQQGTFQVGGGGGAGKALVQDLHMVKRSDKASPNLFAHCCNGKHFGKATLTVRKAGEDPLEYLVYKLEDVLISSYNVAGHEGGGIAQENISLNFRKIEMTYTPQKKEGGGDAKVVKSYDVAANKVA